MLPGKGYLFPTNIFSRQYSNIGKDVQLLVLNFKRMLIINMTYQLHWPIIFCSTREDDEHKIYLFFFFWFCKIGFDIWCINFTDSLTTLLEKLPNCFTFVPVCWFANSSIKYKEGHELDGPYLYSRFRSSTVVTNIHSCLIKFSTS